MTLIRILTMAMAVCAVLGALDRIAGGRFGLAKPFEEGFQMLGPVALSMAGILCLAPLLASGASHLAPFLRHAGLEPALLSSVLQAPTLSKIIVDTVLFFISYRIQRAWVFR